MSIQHANRGIVKKDLQLYYNREFNGSFLGESTLNFFSIPVAFLQKEGNHSTSFTTNTSAGIPDLVVPGNKQVYYSPQYITLVATGAWQNEVNRLIIYPKRDASGGADSYAPSGTYRISFYARVISGNTALGFAFYSNGINNTANLTAKWQRFSANSTYNNGAMIIEFGNINAGSMVCQIACIQVEAKSYATPFTLPALWSPNLVNVTSTSGHTTMTKNTAGVSWTNARVYSSEGYTVPCYVSFKASQTNLNVMIALNSDPATGINYTNLDYAWYADANGIPQVYENGSQIAGYGTYTTSTLFEIIYDGININYYMDGILKRSVARSSTNPLYLDSSFYSNSSAVNSLSFGPLSQINRFSNYTVGGGGLRDISENNINTDLTNAAFNTNGYVFSGSQYITVPYSSNLDRNDFTISGYFRTPTNDNSHDTIVSRNSDVYGTTNGWNISRLRNGLSLANCFRFMIYGDSSSAVEPQGPVISDNVWRHFAVVVDKSGSNTVTIYINGIAYTTPATLPSGNYYPSSGSPPLYIGCNKTNADLWNGDISQILFHGKALTAAEVLQNFNATCKTYGL